jgi:sulfate adenylyltransferase large subunit
MGASLGLAAASTLRFTTAGSVDDGKSTLIGRLLLDAKGLLEDQLAAVERTTRLRGDAGLDLALFTDGLTAEREQGITIDVAYRYFATPARRFIIADTPGHEQYTRNMVTGASTADAAVILVDAAHGIARQTRRHAAVAALLAIPGVIVAVNKMDLVGYDRGVFDAIATIPISALAGDMVVARGERLDWYTGPTLLEALEDAPAAAPAAHLRMPVQLVARSRFGARGEQRGYLGRVESGTLAVGDTVVAWPHDVEARVAGIVTVEGTLERAVPGRSITVLLDHQVDIARGDLLSHRHDAPWITRRFAARVAWMDREPLAPGQRYLLKHGTQTVRATVEAIESRLDLATLDAAAAADSLAFNDLGRVRLVLARAIAADTYAENRATGAFILVDEVTHRTVAGGMIQGGIRHG